MSCDESCCLTFMVTKPETQILMARTEGKAGEPVQIVFSMCREAGCGGCSPSRALLWRGYCDSPMLPRACIQMHSCSGSLVVSHCLPAVYCLHFIFSQYLSVLYMEPSKYHIVCKQGCCVATIILLLDCMRCMVCRQG